MAGDVSKLPKWARDRIELLEQRLADAQSALAVGPEDSDTFVEPYSNAPRPIGKRPRVRFSLGDDHPGGELYADVHVEDDGEGFPTLRVSVSGRGTGRLHVSPEGGNAVRLWGETPYEEGVRTGRFGRIERVGQ